MRDLVKSLIDAADPVGLLAMECPDDEYDSEIADIVDRIQYDESVEDVIDTIDTVFETSFRLVGQPHGESFYVRRGDAWREAATAIVTARDATKEVDA